MLNIQTLLEETANTYHNQSALKFGQTQLTYGQLAHNVVKMVHFLESNGITSNDQVVLFFQNSIVNVLCFLALALLNIRTVPLDSENYSEHMLDVISHDIPINFIIGDGDRFSHVLSEKGIDFININRFSIELQNQTNQIRIKSEPLGKTFLYHYTSGSIGKPKAALHTQANLIQGGLIYKQTYQLSSKDNILLAIPLAHSFGMVSGLIASLVSGSRLVLVDRFTPRQVLQTLGQERITVFIGVPLIYEILTRSHIDKRPDLSALNICLSSGTSLLLNTLEKFEERYDKKIYQVYGTTETGVISAQWPRELNWPDGSVGYPLMEVKLRIIDENGRDLSAMEPGILLVQNSTMFMGYHNCFDATNRSFFYNWFNTGDIAWRDKAGNLYLCGRKETFINVSGKKVNPIEVEEVLLSHPMIQDAIVYGREAGDGGEVVHADVVKCGNVTKGEIMQFCRERLAAYKVPSNLRFVSALKKTNLGKPSRGMFSDMSSK